MNNVTLFDNEGRRIPLKGLKAKVCEPNKDFYLDKPEITKEFCSEQLQKSHELGINTAGITLDPFWQKANEQLEIIKGNKQISNILNGVWWPEILPVLPEKFDLGTILEKYLEIAGKSYEKTFPGKRFHNYRKNTLANEVSIVKESRCEELFEKMKQGPVSGIYFANPLQGWSINAQREQIATLPKGFFLSGLDIVIAMAKRPDILARDFYTPSLDLSAFSWRSADSSLGFWTGVDELVFDSSVNLAVAVDVYSGGLFFCG